MRRNSYAISFGGPQFHPPSLFAHSQLTQQEPYCKSPRFRCFTLLTVGVEGEVMPNVSHSWSHARPQLSYDIPKAVTALIVQT